MPRARALAAIVVALALTFAVIARADDEDTFPAGSETASAGNVTATLSWQKQEDSPGNPRLTITRNGIVAFDQPVPDVVCAECGLSDNLRGDIKVADLDGDGENEVIIQGVDGGIEGDFNLAIYDYRPATGTYGELLKRFPIGDSPTVNGEIKDIGHTGKFEVIGSDARFGGKFGNTVYWFPPIVYRYQRPGGVPGLVNVTKQFLSVVRSNARLAKFAFLDTDDPTSALLDAHDPLIKRGQIADYVADEYLLGTGSVGLHEFDKLIAKGVVGTRRSAAAYRARVLSVLKTLGYR
jgi:hypothetical protein